MAHANLFIGLISGTSVDGVDAALVRIDPGARPRIVHGTTYPFDDGLRDDVKGLINSGRSSLDTLGRIDAALGAAFAQAAVQLLDDSDTTPAAVRAIGCHGQTVWHAPHGVAPFTLQIGDANVIATRTGLVTVADFRRQDVALGGQGAPLVPPFHAACLAHAAEARVVINLGGIANLTVLGAGAASVLKGDAKAPPVLGFDSGPASALCDAWIARHRGVAFDAGGEWARTGTVHAALLQRLLDEPYLRVAPPKSTGKELYNLDYVDAHLVALGATVAAADVQATLLELTARSVADAVNDYGGTPRRAIACGGGVHNAFLMQRLRANLGDIDLQTTADYGLEPDLVEAAAFAWLASRRLAGQSTSLASVTGARRDAVGGAVYQPA